MNDWQMNLTKSVQKADPHGKITTTSTATATTNTNNDHHGTMMGAMQMGMEKQGNASSSSTTTTNNSTHVLIVKGAATLGNKAFSPNHIKIKVGCTVIWTNNDNNIHTVTSGIPNTPNAGQVFENVVTA